MKKILKKILPGILLVTLATPGFAENRKGAVTLSPFVGGYVLDKDQREESRPMFGLRAGYNFTKNFGAEAMAGYSLTETGLKYGSKEADMYRYGIDLLYHFMPDNNFVPFVALGGGGTNFNIPNTPSAESHYAGLVNYGGGVKYFVNPDIALRGDVRHVLLVHDTGKHNLEYAVGLTFNFGGERKAVTAVAVAEAAPEVADTTPPTVVFASPVSGAAVVHLNQKVNVAFSEEMDQTTFTGSTVTLKQGNTPLSGNITSTDSTVTFTPASNLEKGKLYTATVTTGAKDLSGNKMASNYVWGFTAGPVADTTAPTVTFTSPVNGSTAAPVNMKINAAFSEPMDPATVTATTFTLNQGVIPVSGKVAIVASNATFTPAKRLEKGKDYTATIKTGAKDLAGNEMARDYVWKFKAYALPTVVGVLAKLDKSHFEFDSVAISEDGKTILKNNVATLKANPGMNIRVAGYTSASGTDEYNQGLSERRAAAVKDYLVKVGGVDESRISIIGYGEANPAQYEADPSDKLSAAALANMRVVLEVLED